MSQVLIVEDNDDLRDLYAQVARDFGAGVLLAADGQSAIDCLNETPELPKFILLDLMMPGMDGWAFLEYRRHVDAIWAQIPVVICSAAGDRAPTGYVMIRKPISLSQLQQLLETHCGPAVPPRHDSGTGEP